MPFGGDTPSGRRRYWSFLTRAVGQDETTEAILNPLGGYVVGTKEFARTIFQRLEGNPGETPQVHRLRRVFTPDRIWDALTEATGISREEVMLERGTLRDMAMEMLHTLAGWSNDAIGRVFDLHYSTVSRYRKRVREAMRKEKTLHTIFRSVEEKTSK